MPGAMINKPASSGKEISITDMCPPICSQECLAFCPDMCCNGKSKSSAGTRDIQPTLNRPALRIDVPSPPQLQSQRETMLNQPKQQGLVQEAPKLKAVVDTERPAVATVASSKPVVNENQYLNRNAYYSNINNLQQPIRQQIPANAAFNSRKPAPTINGQEHLLMHRSQVNSLAGRRYSSQQQQQQQSKKNCKRSCSAVCSSDCPMSCCDVGKRKRKRSRILRKP